MTDAPLASSPHPSTVVARRSARASAARRRGLSLVLMVLFVLAGPAMATPSFVSSTKDDGLGPTAPPGTLFTYTIVVDNSGSSAAMDVVVSDSFDPCLDLSQFDPATDLVVTPGPFTFNWSSPDLTVSFAGAFAPGRQTIRLLDMRTGAVNPGCCNQAIIRHQADPVGTETTDPASGFPLTCVTIIGSAGCDLVVVGMTYPPLAPTPSSVYVNPCGPGDVRLIPFTSVGSTPLGVPADTSEDITPVGGNELRVYQLDCSCSAAVYLVKNWVSSRIRLAF